MPIKWKSNKKLKPDVILKKISESSDFFQKHEAETALFTMIDFGCDLSSTTKKSFFNKALFESKESNCYSNEKVLARLNKELKNYNKNTKKEFTLLTSLSLTGLCPIQKINLNGCEIRFVIGDFPKKYNSRQSLQKDWNGIFAGLSDYDCKVLVKTKAKLPEEAVHKALEAVDIFRAFMCIYSSPMMQIKLSSSSKLIPINKILFGGLHSLHGSNGKLEVDYFWYEQNFNRVTEYSTTEEKYSRFKSNCIKSLKSLSESKYDSKIKDALIRYVRAFDDSDRNSVIIKGWGAIETLVAPGENNCDAISKRLSYFFLEREYHKQIIEHLREYRNTTVHAGEALDDADTHCYQLQFYFNRLIQFHIGTARFFESLDEANQYLDLPLDLNVLKRKKQLIDKAIKFIAPKRIDT